MATKDTTLKQLRLLNPSTEVIDEDLLRQYDRPVIEKWLSTNSSKISTAAYFRMKNTFGATSPAERTLISDYVLDSEYQRICKELSAENRKTLSRPLVAAVCLALQAQSTSCHSSLFGKHKPAAVSRYVSNFLNMAEKLAPADKSRIQIILRGGQEQTQNIQYVLKTRLAELAAEKGKSIKNLIWCPNFSASSREVLDMLADNQVTARDNGNCFYLGRSDLLSGAPVNLMLYLICVYYNVSADRLLLHDFSQFAVDCDGSELTPFQSNLLSAYLRANPLVQSLAMHEAILLNSVNGGSLI